MKAAVLTVSDGVHAGEREDASGDALEGLLQAEGFEVVRRVVADEQEAIAGAIVELAQDSLLVLTTGGTGFAPRDVTPEATASVIEREAPGIAEAIRSDALERTPHALLSRGRAVADYHIAVAQLQFLSGTILEQYRVNVRPPARRGR